MGGDGGDYMGESIEQNSQTIRGLLNIPRSAFGFVLFTIIFVAGFFFEGQIGLYFNLAGFFIVIGGTMAAALISFRTERLAVTWKVLKTSIRAKKIEPEEIIGVLVDLSLKSKLKGLLSLQEDEEETTVLFLRHALGLLVDGYPVAQIREFLTTEMFFFKTRREEIERILRTIGESSPAFGLIGSIVGLIGMLGGIGDTATILSTIPIALTATLYGVMLANFVFIPLAAHVRERTHHELLLQKIILEGVVAIGSNLHPRTLEMKLKSFLTPSLRRGKLVSIERIREMFKVNKETKTTEESEALVAMAGPTPE
jgi:chemotaxis protein MotA